MWPACPAPAEEESFTSWFLRVADANGTDVVEFARAAFPRANLLARDLDKFVSAPFIELLAGEALLDFETLWGTALRSLQGTLVETIPPQGVSRWVLRVGIYNRTRRRRGQQWCPLCLKDGPFPFYRLAWRLALSTTCVRHGVVLADCCHGCGAPANLLKSGDLYCHVCLADRRAHPLVESDPQVLVFERRLLQLIFTPDIPRTPLEAQHPLAYFGTLHAVMGALVRGVRHRALRARASDLWGGDPSLTASGPLMVEDFDVADRHRTMGLAARLMTDWPERFVETCRSAQCSRAHLFAFRRARECPYQFVQPVIEHLTFCTAKTDPKQSHDRRERPYHGRVCRRAIRKRELRMRKALGEPPRAVLA